MLSLARLLRRVLRRRSGEASSGTPPPGTDRDDPCRAAIERLVGMPVHDVALYTRALSHRSVARGRPDSHRYSNERLEFLGDAVLGFVVAEYLYRHFPDHDEGFLTRLRAKLVNGQTLARFAREIDLGPHLRMSDNMAQAGGRDNPSILADAFEALIGALYLDQGPAAARAFIQRVVLDAVDLDALARRRDNFKSLLLEYVQAHGWPQPRYRVTAEEGPSHERTFTVEVLLGDRP
ncbi:MAG: ribonuclease III, partial [Bacteroidetes bacterium]